MLSIMGFFFDISVNISLFDALMRPLEFVRLWGELIRLLWGLVRHSLGSLENPV